MAHTNYHWDINAPKIIAMSEAGKTTAMIADELGLPYAAVYQYCKNHEVPINLKWGAISTVDSTLTKNDKARAAQYVVLKDPFGVPAQCLS